MNKNKVNMVMTAALIFMALTAGMDRCWAQASLASVTGVVTDQGQAAVPAAQVTIQNKNTGDKRTTSTSHEGRFTYSLLIPGSYELTVTMIGFKKAVQDVDLSSGQAAELNVQLALGTVAETLEVSATPIALDTQSANQNTTINQTQVQELPVNYRNPLSLVFAAAGVKSMVAQVGIRSFEDSFMDMDMGLFAYNGGREGTNNINIDGISAKGGDWGTTFAVPQVDVVQEMQISRNTYDAEYGRVANGVVNVVTRGGSNQWHGTLFEFLRNDKLDANRWEFNKAGEPKPPVRRNQFGGNASGPIWKGKRLYFLFGYEGARIRETVANTDSVPSLLERQGNFSQSRNADGSLQTIYDPFTTRANPSGSGFIRDPFPGNSIPASRLDPVGVAFTNTLFAKPTQAGASGTDGNNFFGSGNHFRDSDRWDGRLDWARNEKHSMFVHVTRSYFKELDPRIFKTGIEDRNVSPHAVDRGGPSYQMTLSNTYVPSPTWVINAAVGGGANIFYANPTSIANKIGLTNIGYSSAFASQLPPNQVGSWTLEDYETLGSNSSFVQAIRTNSVAVNVTHEHGAHSVKFGFSGEDLILNQTTLFSLNMSFNRGPTVGPIAAPDSNVTGNSVASLLLGVGGAGLSGGGPFSAGGTTVGLAPASSNKAFGWYAQDTWKATRKLTLTLGLRYELQMPRTERYNRQNYFDFNLANPMGGKVGLPLNGGLVFSTSQNRGQTDLESKNFAPRIGIVYKLTDKLVVRSGYGISYTRSVVDAGVNGNDGFSQDTPWVVSPGGVVPQYLLSNPFPNGLTQPPGSSLGALTYVGLSPTAWNRHNPTPYVQSYSLDFEYQLGSNSVFEIGYTGNVGRKLAYGVNVNYDQLNPQYLSLGQALNDLVPNPFYGAITTGSLSGPTVPRYQLLLPYPQFASVNSPQSKKGTSSNFNALYLKFNHRFQGGLSLLTTYQWSKALDNSSEDQGWWLADAQRDAYNTKADYSISAHDEPQDLVNTLIYEVPVGKGRRFGSHMSRVPEAILGHWSISGVVKFASGTPLGLIAPNTLAAYGFAVQRPNIGDVKQLIPSGFVKTPERWWNVNAVTAPGTFQIGNAPRLLPNVRIDGIKNADAALLKDFLMPRERMKLQFRAEAFNLLNTPLFGIQPGSANVTLGSGAFGTATSTFLTGSREIQLGLKMTF